MKNELHAQTISNCHAIKASILVSAICHKVEPIANEEEMVKITKVLALLEANLRFAAGRQWVIMAFLKIAIVNLQNILNMPVRGLVFLAFVESRKQYRFSPIHFSATERPQTENNKY
jgi:hypothetical protein